jgi:hypothetical protein
MRHAARMEDMRNVIKIFIENPEGMRPFGKPMRKWEYIIKTYLKVTEFEDADLIYSTQNRS